MAETLGSLCDKLTIVKLKQFHVSDIARLDSLNIQEIQLKGEIDRYIQEAISGLIPLDRLRFASNKIYKQEGNETRQIKGSMAEIFAELAKVNCELWHEQEKVYDFSAVPLDEKDQVVKRLAVLNLERNKCMDLINDILFSLCQK